MLHFYYLADCMKHRGIILSCIAVFLMLIFSLKSGAGLFLHNFLHTGNPAHEAPLTEDTKTVNYGCTCIDDFLMPFDETVNPVFSRLCSHIPITTSLFRDDIPFCILVFSSLRGPPADRLS